MSVEETRPQEGPKGLGPMDALYALLVLLAAAAVLYVYSDVLLRSDKIHIGPHLNDQAGYITTARWYAETGELRSHLVYPAYVENPDFRLYMPGHYYALAQSYKAFGDQAMTWRIPNMISYFISALGTFLIGRKLFGRMAGLLAAFVMIAFPANVNYAFTAMSEPTLTAAAVLSLTALVFVPVRFRFAAVPVVLALPFLFRESSALLVAPMALLAMRGAALKPRWAFLVATVGSVVVLSVLNAWQIRSGKEPTPLTWVTEGAFNYDKALQGPPPEIPITEFIPAAYQNFLRTSEMYLGRLLHGESPEGEPYQTLVIILLAVGCTVVGAWRWKKGGFLVGVGLLGLGLLALDLFLYDMFGYRGLRITLMSLPFTAVAAAGFVVPLVARLLERFSRQVRIGIVAALCLVFVYVSMDWSKAQSLMMNHNMRGRMQARHRGHLERLRHNDERMLISPSFMSMDYVLRHYPVRWSFPPADEHTLRLLSERFDIGTLILPAPAVRTAFSVSVLNELGFSFDHEITIVGREEDAFMLFRRRRGR